jgi:hypothetical protein
VPPIDVVRCLFGSDFGEGSSRRPVASSLARCYHQADDPPSFELQGRDHSTAEVASVTPCEGDSI